MKKNRYIILLGALALMTVSACIKEDSTSNATYQKQYLQLWIDTYHPGVSQNSDGLYILEDIPGTGSAIEWGENDDYVYADVTIRTLDGTISSSTDIKLAQQLGTYDKKNGVYYGPRFYKIGEGSSYAGVDALYNGMNLGGTRTAVIPSWMITTSRYNTQQEYLNNLPSNSSHLIYTVRPRMQCEDPTMVELDSLKKYVTAHYGDLASISYKDDEAADGTFYFISDLTNADMGEEESEPTKRTSTTTATLNYTGRLLNGQVFDTTVEKVAKDAGIYNASKTYSPVSITFAEKWSEISMGGSTSLIDGFKGALYQMNYPGEKATALFTSIHGYGETGDTQTNKIPGYSPLIFEFELVTVSDLE